MNTAILALAMALASTPAIELDDAPVYVAGGQYTATLSQLTGRWQLLPIDAADRIVRSECAQEVHLPPGLWLINRNASGEPELLAPSGTALPPGYRERIALASCDAPATGALRAPAELIDWLVEHAGAVWVDE